MKILFLNTNIGYGGASKILAGLANYLSEKNNEITFLTYRNPEVLQRLDKKVNHLHMTLFKHPVKIIERLGEMIMLHKYIKSGKFDIALSFLHPAKYLLISACKFTGTKVVVSERGDPFVKYNNENIGNKLIGKITETADAFVFQTIEAQKFFPEKVVERSMVIPNPVFSNNVPDRFIGERENEIVNVARLDIFQKRQDVLLEAFAKINKKYDNYVLKLYGSGPDGDRLKKLSEDLGISDKVIFKGYVENVIEFINRASLFVLSSDFEGIPNALIEAMSSGVPCISTDCSPGGARLLIKNKVNGLLVPANNPDKLAEAMDYMLSNKEDSDKMAANAINITKEFEEEKIYAEWEKLINGLCCKKL
jgi:glycosyltransferase involved in cell wall biosynthesis